MDVKYLIAFNIFIFMGFGVEIALGRRRPRAASRFASAAVNSLSLLANVLLLYCFRDSFPVFFNPHRLFLLSLVSGYFINEALFVALFRGERDVFDSLNTVNCGFPFFMLSAPPFGAGCAAGFASVFIQGLGSAAGFFCAALIFNFLRSRTDDEASGENEFNVLCYELVALGLMSASFSMFFRVI